MSGHHAQLTYRDGAWWLRDLGSRNGTRLDGRRVPTDVDVRVVPGCCLEFGTEDSLWRLLDGRPPGDQGERIVRPNQAATTLDRPPTLSDVRFRFRCTPDGLRASWRVELPSTTVELGDQPFVVLLAVLASERLNDGERRLGRAERGWMAVSDVLSRLGTTPADLEIEIYRARRQLRRLRLIGANGLIERRERSLRFGTDMAQVTVGEP